MCVVGKWPRWLTKLFVKTAEMINRKLYFSKMYATCITVWFCITLFTGGYFAGSLAIMTDAAHMLSDFAGFLISLFAIWLASRPSSNRMSFGWHRAGTRSVNCKVESSSEHATIYSVLPKFNLIRA